MKHSMIAFVLVALLFISATITAVFALSYSFGTRELRRLQPQVVQINSRMALAQALLNDTLEYSKQNPAIDPLLKSLNLKPGEGASATNPPTPSN